jgi:hypothetical protein
MAEKVIFHGSTKQIVVNPGVLQLDVKIDLYSAWKRWSVDGNNLGYLQAFRTFGGDPTIAGQFAPQYFFLTNGWRIIVDTGEEITAGTNLYTDELDNPFIVGLSSAVSLRNSDAVVVDNGISENLDYNGLVHINSTIGVPGTGYPIGTIALPSSNLIDAKTIADNRGITSFRIYGTTVFNTDLMGYNVYGGNIRDIVVFQNVNVSDTTFKECILAGSYSGFIAGETVQLSDGLTGMNGVFKDSGIHGRMYFSPSATTSILNCSSMVPGNSNTPAVFLRNDVKLSIRKYSGTMDIFDCQEGVEASLEFMAGTCKILSGNTGGEVTISGIANFVNQSSGTTINRSALLLAQDIATQHLLNVNTEILKNK